MLFHCIPEAVDMGSCRHPFLGSLEYLTEQKKDSAHFPSHLRVARVPISVLQTFCFSCPST